MIFKSKFLQDFQTRGFLAQATHLEELDQILATQKITAYIGFDCTASSLHAGSLIQIMILRLLQKHGHRAIVLLGGGTTKIGDPSGKDEARQILTEEKIQENFTGIKKNLEQFISFDGPNGALLVNNDEWLKNLNYIDFLRDIGRHFSINRMLTFDSVKSRLEREQPLSFLEFNYMILQAYDFYELNKKHGCILQIGGSDQWGNIVNGVELTRRIAGKSTFGLTSPLLTTADNKKMGKSADGAVWLDSALLSPFDYFQYFRNTHDADVIKFLKLFTDLEISQINELARLQDHEINKAKEILAFEATKICHGIEAANQALQKAREIFINKNNTAFEIFEIQGIGKKLAEIIKETGATSSNSEAKKLIEGKAVKINGELVADPNIAIEKTGEFDLSIGKKRFFKIRIL